MTVMVVVVVRHEGRNGDDGGSDNEKKCEMVMMVVRYEGDSGDDGEI